MRIILNSHEADLAKYLKEQKEVSIRMLDETDRDTADLLVELGVLMFDFRAGVYFLNPKSKALGLLYGFAS